MGKCESVLSAECESLWRVECECLGLWFAEYELWRCRVLGYIYIGLCVRVCGIAYWVYALCYTDY